MSTVITAPRDENDWVGYERVAARSFGKSTRNTAMFREHGLTRLVLDGGQVIAGATALLAHQYFGGRAVPAGCVSLVCVSPEHRGNGLAARLIADLVAQMRSYGCLVASLWTPSTGVYRRWGWEVTGVGRRWVLPTRALRTRPDAGYRVVPGLVPEVRTLHERVAIRWDGPVRRPGWWWRWKYPSDSDHAVYRLVGSDDQVRGFVTYQPRLTEPWGHHIEVSECWAADSEALLGLYDFLGGHATLSDQVTFTQAALPAMPSFLWRLDQHEATEQGWYPWMMRMLDPEAALRARGWPDGVSGELELEIGAGKRISVKADGARTTVSAGGTGQIRIPEGEFVAWYAGALDAGRLRELAWPGARTADIELMTALVSGRGPWLPDTF
ncbi:MAG: GNAT family N-acetyltransferase [Kibdelosporangium sp.]